MADVDAGQDVIGRIAQLTDKQRATVMNHLVDMYKSTVVKLFSRFHKCDSCDQMVTKITHECQSRNGFVESCCDWCATLCVCGRHYAPDGASRHEDCHQRMTRCFCGKTINLQKRELHGDECVRFAAVHLTVLGEINDELKMRVTSVVRKHEMEPDDDLARRTWTSVKSYKTTALDTYETLGDANLDSFFGLFCGQELHEIPLGGFGFAIDYIRPDMTWRTQHFDDDELQEIFAGPDVNSSEVFEGISFHAFMQVAGERVQVGLKRKKLEECKTERAHVLV
jgi:hypothetical protein